MGLFDTISIAGAPEAQVKCWNSQCLIRGLGDEVDPLDDGATNYQIALLEGGFLLVRDNIIEGWREDCWPDIPIYDKWGDPYESGVYDAWVKGGHHETR